MFVELVQCHSAGRLPFCADVLSTWYMPLNIRVPLLCQPSVMLHLPNIIESYYMFEKLKVSPCILVPPTHLDFHLKSPAPTQTRPSTKHKANSTQSKHGTEEAHHCLRTHCLYEFTTNGNAHQRGKRCDEVHRAIIPSELLCAAKLSHTSGRQRCPTTRSEAK